MDPELFEPEPVLSFSKVHVIAAVSIFLVALVGAFILGRQSIQVNQGSDSGNEVPTGVYDGSEGEYIRPTTSSQSNDFGEEQLTPYPITASCESDADCQSITCDGLSCPEEKCINGYCQFVDQKAQTCAQAGGTWREFPNGCADMCGLDINSVCTQAFTMGCDCGGSSCWDGGQCIPNE